LSDSLIKKKMIRRNAYLLTLNPRSERALFSKSVLERVGFTVTFAPVVPDQDKVLSNKKSMQAIFSTVAESSDAYSYVFEDDINLLDEIRLGEVVQYEPRAEMFFYLGLCEYGPKNAVDTGIVIEGHRVFQKAGGCRGLHAFGLSKKGAAKLLACSVLDEERYMDVILEKFSISHPAHVVRYDLQANVRHMGVFFQDRARFPSTIS